MENPQRLVDKIAPLMAEAMGDQTAELFRTLYALKDDEEVMSGAYSLLSELMGKEMAEQKLMAMKAIQ